MTALLSPPVWVTELAERFWSAAGTPPPFPRDLTAAATGAARLSFVDVPNLSLVSILEFLQRNGIPATVPQPDRPLRAALYCWRDAGFVFLEKDDPPAERRFSVAHEVAHFLRDAAAVRAKVEKALGKESLAVLDGCRPATADERIRAVLRGLTLAPHVHLMNRNADGRPAGDAERDAEAGADRLAYELLAPAALMQGESDRAALTVRLVAAFGLPVSAARAYAGLLLPDEVPTDRLFSHLSTFH